MGIDFASSEMLPGDQAAAVLLHRDNDGNFCVLGSWVGADSVLRARRLAIALGVHVSQEGFTPTVNAKEKP